MIADIGGSEHRGWWRDPGDYVIRPYRSAIRLAEDGLGIGVDQLRLPYPPPQAWLLAGWGRDGWGDPVC